MRLCAAVLGLVGGGRAMDDNTIRAAVDLWESDKAAAEAQYGPISAWDTADVVDMKELFRYTEKNEFNENIGAWNTSSVTSMNRMFSYAHKFNQPIGVFAASFCAGTPSTRSTHAGAWDVRKVKDFECMFCYAEMFNQDIGILRRPFFVLGLQHAIAAILLQQGHWRVTSTPSPRSRTRAGDWRVDNAETIDRMFYGASAFDQDLGWCTLASVDSAFLNSPCQSNDCVLPCPSFPFLCLFSDLFDLFSVAVTLRRHPWRGAYGRAIRSGPPDAIGAASRRRVRAQAASCAESVPRTRGRSERASPRRRRRRRPTRRGESATAAPTTGGGAKITIFVSNRTQLSRT